jgi:hypothetical protein
MSRHYRLSTKVLRSLATIILVLSTTSSSMAQVPPLTPARRAELEAIVAKDQGNDSADTAVDIAYLISDLMDRKQPQEARRLTGRLVNDIKLLPDTPFEYYTNCAFTKVVGDYENAKCDSDAQEVLAACFTKQSHAESGCTSPVAINVDWSPALFGKTQ